MTPTHRRYQDTDREACMALLDSNVPRFFSDHERPDFIEFLGTADRAYLVVTNGNTVVGCGGFTLSDNNRVANLCWGMVHRDHHGKGLGALLLRARLQAIAANAPACFVRLATSQFTAGFYQQYGFVVQSIQPDGFAPGLDAVEMRLSLQSMPPKLLST